MPILKKNKDTGPPGQEPGAQSSPRPEAGTRAERKWIKKERRKLRKELRGKGIKSYADFEMVARDLSLTVDMGKRAGLLAALGNMQNMAATAVGLKSLMLASGAFLTMVFAASTITDKAGSFTINLTADMLRSGFILSDSRDFSREESRLFSEKVQEVNNMTLEDITKDVDMTDGSHNGQNYMAYTFYIKNTGEEDASYSYFINISDQTMNVGSAVWLMLFEDGRQIVYAMKSEDGDPEELYGYENPPFMNAAYDQDAQYYKEGDEYGVITTPFADETVVAQGLVENVKPQEIHKYTVVLWVEGYDPQCTNDIFGGYAKFSMDFEKASKEDTANIFNGVYRTEYQDYDPTGNTSAN